MTIENEYKEIWLEPEEDWTPKTVSGINDNKIDNNVSIMNIPEGETSAGDWANELVFSSSVYNIVAWTTGDIVLEDGTTYTIASGNTGVITTVTYIYLTKSLSTLSTTTSASTSVGTDKLLICVASPSVSGKNAEWQAFGTNSQSKLVFADAIAANTVTANEIATNTITTNELNATSINLGTLGGDLDDIDDGDATTGYSKVLSTSISAGKIKLSESFDTITSVPGVGTLASENNLDGVPNGITYSRTATASLTAGGLVIMSQINGTLDDIDDGDATTGYSKVLSTSITAGQIILAQTSGDLDDISDGTTYNKTTVNEVTGAGRGFNALNSSNRYQTWLDASELDSATLPTNGVVLGSQGIVGRKAGVTTFELDTSGDALFRGTIYAAAGEITGDLDIISGGSLFVGGTGTGMFIQNTVDGPGLDFYDSNQPVGTLIGEYAKSITIAGQSVTINCLSMDKSLYVGADLIVQDDLLIDDDVWIGDVLTVEGISNFKANVEFTGTTFDLNNSELRGVKTIGNDWVSNGEAVIVTGTPTTTDPGGVVHYVAANIGGVSTNLVVKH